MLEASPADLEIDNAMISVKGAPQRAVPLGADRDAGLYGAPTPAAGGRADFEATTTSTATRAAGRRRPTRVGRRRPRDRAGEDRALPRRRGLRHDDQPGDRRRPGARGRRAGHRRRAVRAAAYDEDGQFLAGTFMDYLLPTTTEVPTSRSTTSKLPHQRRELPRRRRRRRHLRAGRAHQRHRRRPAPRSASRSSNSTCPRPAFWS